MTLPTESVRTSNTNTGNGQNNSNSGLGQNNTPTITPTEETGETPPATEATGNSQSETPTASTQSVSSDTVTPEEALSVEQTLSGTENGEPNDAKKPQSTPSESPPGKGKKSGV
ncbi:MAG: hypothetical protein IGS03_11460 [Candidatus Sericytochromatia bacterium]|nr:hypothetical protein [Candidatus Sericytochromatia bacterium]